MIEFTVGQKVRVNDPTDERHGQTFTITEVAEAKWQPGPKYALGAEDTAGEFGVWFDYLELVA